MVKNNENFRLELNLHAVGSCYDKSFGDNGIIKTQVCLFTVD